MYHDIGWPEASNAAQIAIEGGALAVTAGTWPGFGCSVSVSAVQVQLVPEDQFVYLDREGNVVVSDQFIAYGQDAAGNANEMLDLLAWQLGGEWHIKLLVPAEG